MGDMGNKVKGAAKEAAGKAQQAWGEATDQAEHSAKGMGKEAAGKAQRKAGEAEESIKERVDEPTGERKP
ncbi:MAG TPA: CsbD family protein [Thermodesulfobacteriota bacterium]